MVSSQAKNGFNCVSCGTHRGGPAGGCVIRKTRTPPEGIGLGLGNPHVRVMVLVEGSVRQTHGRARGSSRKPRHTFLEASGSLTDWTPRAGVGCPRSLAHLAAR